MENHLQPSVITLVSCKMNLLVNGRPIHHSIRVQQEVLLADASCCCIYGNQREAHLKDPAVHNLMDCIGQI